MKFTIVNGCPGGGKTDRVVRQTEENVQKYGPSGNLIITFSRTGAEEITKRLRGDILAYTHHGFGYKIVRLGAKSREEKAPMIADEKKSRQIMERAIVKVGAALDCADVMADMARVRERGMDMEALPENVQKVIRQYRVFLKDQKLLDFAGILERARWELENNPSVRMAYERWNILEDEFHDTNPWTEWPIIELLAQGAESFTGFASPSQTIFMFRGADYPLLQKKFSAGREVREEFLRVNYRSTKEIVDAARLLAGPDASDMVSAKGPSGEKVQLIDAIRPEMEIDAAMRQIAAWKREGIPFKEMAVLGRSHKVLLPIEQALLQRGVSYVLNGHQEDFLTGSEMRAYAGYLRLAVDPMDDSVLEAIIDYPPCGIGARTRRMLRGDETLGWDHLIAALAEPNRYRPQVIERVRKILDLREEWDELAQSKLGIQEKAEKVLEGSEIRDYLLTEGDWATLTAMQKMIEGAVEYSSFGEYAERMEADTRTARAAEGITLSTMHASKGIQKEAVLIAQFADGLVPMSKGDEVEERNLAFVSLTRPKTHLTITNNRTAGISPFLMGMQVENTPWP